MPSPRRRGSRLRILLPCVLSLSACTEGDDGLDPQIRAPETGTYAYDAVLHTSDSLPPDILSGTLSISISSEDSIIGAWSVPGYTGAPARGTWNINAYILPANPTSIQGTVRHRVWRATGNNNLTCRLSYERVDMPADTFRSSSENDCTLLRSGT